MKHADNEFENSAQDLTRVQKWPRSPRSTNPVAIGIVLVITLVTGLTIVTVLVGS